MTPNQERFVQLIDELKQLMPVVEAEIIGAFSGSVGAASKKQKKIKSDEEIKRIVMKRSFYKK
ncbi:hypothetical protein [Epilithonimonas caeni]|uniref:hypothetical protein n=1 Tax=Epilithonimonas caeni TaxID=365343 RepID=UPI000415A89F|nr:hypothetical protein [Epilithonimonas caeni]